MPRYKIHKSQASEAWDDKYTFQFDVTVLNQLYWEPEFSGYMPGWVDVGMYVAKSSGVWELVSVLRVYGDGGGSSTARTNQTQTVTVDGLGQHAGREFGIVLYDELVEGGAIDSFDSVVYSTAGSPTETSATAGGVSPVPYVVIA